MYGSVVPFYNYLQAAFVLHEDGRVAAVWSSASRETSSLAQLRAGALARSTAIWVRRGHVRGRVMHELAEAYAALTQRRMRRRASCTRR